MTAVELLALICAAWLIQLALGIGVVLRRRRIAASVAPPPAAEQHAGADLAWPGWREFRVARRELEDVARTQCSFYLQPVDGQPLPAFRPGQFLTFSLTWAAGAAGEAGRTITRCYSLSDRPDPAHYRVTIKRVPAPQGQPDVLPGLSSNHFHDHVRVGDVLRVKAPSGHFCIDPDAAVPVVLIGGGIGITPMMSMLRWCIAHQPQRPVHLFYGLRNSDEHAFKAQLEALAAAHPAMTLQVVYSRPTAADVPGRDFQHLGHVDIDLLRKTVPHGRHQFYICGPAAMMQTLVPALADWGVPLADIHHEAFGPASVTRPVVPAAAPPEAMGVEVRFQRSGRTLAWNGSDASLLDFAERHGIAVESGCRSGGCGSCETRVLEGTVAYPQAPDHDVARGHCLLCVGRPTTALVLEA
ncbi:2Fe-2S iron-sulfur cluster binding domain-containing protein [Ideonella sp. 4Y16]|uniref:2Fe-2S iron-sulfur cluster-binding protein n=1 Tax=Ideonella alba TaxID=2824118 RepID=UPI001B391B07|nr:2Fe-2S iron-sulfur cluster-binding protein [Ideonella alba]MBQ0945551.1 2Fe-2S iron-sulfur cluster binding domain-containing protein [Ideonella alba]